jgi:hypothetical protein
MAMASISMVILTTEVTLDTPAESCYIDYETLGTGCEHCEGHIDGQSRTVDGQCLEALILPGPSEYVEAAPSVPARSVRERLSPVRYAT